MRGVALRRLLQGGIFLALISINAFAVPITVGNPSFEVPAFSAGTVAPGLVGAPWTMGNGTAGGTWNVPTSIATPADGSQVVYLGGMTFVNQVLSANVTPGALYALTISVGRRADTVPGTAYSLQLFAGSTQIGVLNGSTVSQAGGVLVPATLTTTASGSASGALSIRFSAGSSTTDPGQSLFDLARLDETVAAGAVPEPVSTGLLGSGLIALALMRRLRTQR